MNVEIRYPTRNTKQIDVKIGKLQLCFSYNTIVAFESPFSGFVISENIWSTTTGRHLNEIDSDKSRRINNTKFLIILTETLQHYGLED